MSVIIPVEKSPRTKTSWILIEVDLKFELKLIEIDPVAALTLRNSCPTSTLMQQWTYHIICTTLIHDSLSYCMLVCNRELLVVRQQQLMCSNPLLLT